jgi:hypothetical protein
MGSVITVKIFRVRFLFQSKSCMNIKHCRQFLSELPISFLHTPQHPLKPFHQISLLTLILNANTSEYQALNTAVWLMFVHARGRHFQKRFLMQTLERRTNTSSWLEKKKSRLRLCEKMDIRKRRQREKERKGAWRRQRKIQRRKRTTIRPQWPPILQSKDVSISTTFSLGDRYSCQYHFPPQSFTLWLVPRNTEYKYWL